MKCCLCLKPVRVWRRPYVEFSPTIRAHFECWIDEHLPSSPPRRRHRTTDHEIVCAFFRGFFAGKASPYRQDGRDAADALAAAERGGLLRVIR